MGIAGGIAWGRMSFYNGFSFRMSTKGIYCVGRVSETVANQASRTTHLAKGQNSLQLYIIYKMRPICFKYTTQLLSHNKMVRKCGSKIKIIQLKRRHKWVEHSNIYATEFWQLHYNDRQTLTWNRAPLFFWACEGEEASSPLLSFDFFSFFSFFFFGGGRLSGRPLPVRR